MLCAYIECNLRLKLIQRLIQIAHKGLILMLVSDQREWVYSLSCGNVGRMSGGKYQGEMTSWGFHRHHSTLNVSKLPIGAAGLIGMCALCNA